MHTTRKLRFESLERRHLLAVDVQVLATGDLLIAGSEAADAITITQGVDTWQIQGAGSTVTALGGIGTQVDPQTVMVDRLAIKDTRILLGPGNDSLSLFGLFYFGDLHIDMGTGGDTVNLGSFEDPLPGAFNAGGSNANSLLRMYVTLGTDSFQEPGNSLTILNSVFGNINAGGPSGVNVRGSAGPDTVTMRGVTCWTGGLGGGAMDIQTMGGDDLVSLGEVQSGISLRQFGVQVGNGLHIDVGSSASSGNDSVVLEAVGVGNYIVIRSGTGNDKIRIGSAASDPAAQYVGTSTGDLVIHTNHGVDTVFLKQVTTIGCLLVESTGTSSITVRNSSFSNDAAIIVRGLRSVNFFPLFDAPAVIDIDAANFARNLYITTGGGHDVVDLQGALVTAGVLTLTTSAANDTIRVDNASIKTAVIMAGYGDDSVALTANLIDDLFADLDDGHDLLRSESVFRIRGFARGGPGGNLGTGSNFLPGVNFIFEGFGA